MLSGSTAALGSAATRVYIATVEDAGGNTVTSGTDATDSLTFSQPSGTGSVSGLRAVAASGGVATVTVTGVLAGTVTLQAAGTLNGTARTSNTIAFTVTFGPATQIVLSGSTAALASGATRVFTVTIEDAAGSTVTGGAAATDSVTFSQPSGTGSVTGLPTAVASGGVATVTIAGVQVGPVTGQAAATSTARPEPPTRLRSP